MTSNTEFDPMNQLPVDAAVQADDQAADDPGPTAGTPTTHAPPDVGTTTTTTNDTGTTMSNDDPGNPGTPRTQRMNRIAAVEVAQSDGESPNATNRQQQEGTGAASSNTMPPGLRVPVERSIFTPPPPKAPAAMDGSVAAMVQMMAGMQETINNLTKQVMELTRDKAARNDREDVVASNVMARDKAPMIHHKDVEKPAKYDGKAWVTWSDDFKNFLERRDERWGVLLSKIQEKEFVNAPLTEDRMADLASEIKLKSELQVAFKKQLFEYLRTYTAGETLATVLAAGAEQSWETWRRLSDQGRCLRLRPLREEHRALYHPKQCTEDSLIKGISSWELRLLNYEAAKPTDEASMSENLKIMCLEDMCPEHIQKYLSSKNLVDKLKTYSDYKLAIDEFFYEERRWGKNGRHKLHAIEDRGGDGHDADDGPDHDPSKAATAAYPSDWAAALMGEINALVKGKLRNKGTGKGYNAGKTNHPTPMDVDKPDDAQKAKTDDRKCYECGKLGHIGRDCAIRQARVAAGGPPILKGDGKGGKGGKGGGKWGQGGQQWPSAQQWKTMYPGPSMQTWNSWQPGKGGKASLFEAPQQLSAFNALFQGPSAFAIAPKKKTVPRRHADTEKVDYESENTFKALEEDTLDENLSTTDPPGSGARSRVPADEPVTAKPPRGRRHECSRNPGTSSFQKLSHTGVQDFRTAVSETPPLANFVNENGKVTTDKKYAKDKNDLPNPESTPSKDATGTGERATPRERPAETGGHQSRNEHYVTPERAAFLKKPSEDMPELKPCTGDSTTTSSRARSEAPESSTNTRLRATPSKEPRERGKMEVKITDALKPPSRNQERKKATGIGKKVDFNNVNDELIDYICGKTKKMGNLNMFNEVRGQSCICPVTGTWTPTSSTSPPGEQDSRSAIDPTKWEVMHAVVDSGATVPVLHPKTGGVYQVEESPASRAGVEYEIANGSTLPCLGQKHMAVMTEEGTLRGYTSQCADVSKALQAVRSMVGSRHAVCFGLGPAGEDHLIINRESGEINRMIDDGVNYLQKLFVVPPDQVEAVQERLQQAQDFTRRGE